MYPRKQGFLDEKITGWVISFWYHILINCDNISYNHFVFLQGLLQQNEVISSVPELARGKCDLFPRHFDRCALFPLRSQFR